MLVVTFKYDAPGGILARAGPCGYKAPSAPLTIMGQIEIDAADLTSPIPEDVVWHEIAHAMGISSIGQTWSDLLTGATTPNPQFWGVSANNEWRDLDGPFDGVPVQEGSAHWRESWFDSEIMTPFTEGNLPLPISRMTIGALQDLGWIVDFSTAEEYVLPCTAECPSLVAPLSVDEADELFDLEVPADLLPLPRDGRPRPSTASGR